MVIYTIITTAIFAYLIGGMMFAIILTKAFKGFDVREKGSNNAGTTNVIRTSGWKMGGITFVLDVLKGSIAVLLAYVTHKITGVNVEILAAVAGIFVILGHTFPLLFGFKGGKGVATVLGVMLVINPMIVAIAFIFGLVLIAFTKIVSIASITGALLFPVLSLFLYPQTTPIVKDIEGSPLVYTVFSILVALLIIYNHRTNIKKLKQGQENKLSFGKKG